MFMHWSHRGNGRRWLFSTAFFERRLGPRTVGLRCRADGASGVFKPHPGAGAMSTLKDPLPRTESEIGGAPPKSPSSCCGQAGI